MEEDQIVLMQKDIEERFQRTTLAYVPGITISNIADEAFLLTDDKKIICRKKDYKGYWEDVKFVGRVTLSDLNQILSSTSSMIVTFQVFKVIHR